MMSSTEKMRQNLVKADDTVRELHAAVSLHHDGDLVGATKKMQDAVDALAKLIQSEPKKAQRGDLTQTVPETWDAEELDANGLFDSLCDTHKDPLGARCRPSWKDRRSRS